MTLSTTILILGGYGTFGGRLAELLAVDARVTLLIAGRSLAQAQCFCERLAPGAARRGLHFDRDGDALEQQRAVDPDLVVDASGRSNAMAPIRTESSKRASSNASTTSTSPMGPISSRESPSLIARRASAGYSSCRA
jgi:hypothetical protein